MGLGLKDLSNNGAKRKEVELPAELKQKLQERQEARENKDWEKSDAIREYFKETGFDIIDTKDGQTVKKI